MDYENKVNSVHHSVNEYGQVLVDMRNLCNVKCNNLIDTHEVTLAEKSCLFNCFKKMNYAYNNFNRMTNEEMDSLSGLKAEPNQQFRF